jgi:hypothetical protein
MMDIKFSARDWLQRFRREMLQACKRCCGHLAGRVRTAYKVDLVRAATIRCTSSDETPRTLCRCAAWSLLLAPGSLWGSSRLPSLLILIELKGGDGLNTVVPYADQNFLAQAAALVRRDDVLARRRTGCIRR